MQSNAIKQREFCFTDAHFKRVKTVLYAHAGIVLANNKQDMAYNRLVRRIRDLNLQNFDQYLEDIESDVNEFSLFINAMTTNLTAFFRESHHFDFIAKTIIPQVALSGNRRLRIWSAGCSLGEEPYSLAMALLSSGQDMRNWDVRILATDIDSDVLNKARLGVYAEERVAGLPRGYLPKFFLKGKGSSAGDVQARAELREMITFKYLNLMEQWPLKGPLDFIFCRNVMIYFDKKTQAKLLERMAALLKPDGYLFVGHSEALARHDSHFRLIGKTIYQKESRRG
ncbi:chemotaxis protein CheR ['Osedax' symbiont bacterium Rs2_46_30_T18]|nr:chemotaxis protein CheR ['Osedax' symbiont bacterium Rs2_46_30_T18]